MGAVSSSNDTAGESTAQQPSTLYLVKRLEMAIRAQMDDVLRGLGLTTNQYTALTVLERRGGISSAQLARRSFVRPQTMHVMVNALERRGLIQREADPNDRKVLRARLTDRGRALLMQATPRIDELEARLFAQLNAESRAGFRTILRQGIVALTPRDDV